MFGETIWLCNRKPCEDGAGPRMPFLSAWGCPWATLYTGFKQPHDANIAFNLSLFPCMSGGSPLAVPYLDASRHITGSILLSSHMPELAAKLQWILMELNRSVRNSEVYYMHCCWGAALQVLLCMGVSIINLRICSWIYNFLAACVLLLFEFLMPSFRLYCI